MAAIGSHLRRRLLGTIRRADGRLQVTYNHKPLYHPGHNIMPCGAQTTAQFRGTFAYIDVTGQPGDVYCGPY